MSTKVAVNSGPEENLLEVQDLVVQYRTGLLTPPLRAVDGVSLTIAPQETVGVVGESGSGKSTLGRAILGLSPVHEGAIRFDSTDITTAGYKQRRSLSRDLQVVFQDPYSSLNPTMSIGQTLSETFSVAGRAGRADVKAQVARMLDRVGMSASAAARYPRHFSGGQRQRIAIARALMSQPRLVICDEPVSALDLSVQAQVLNLLSDLQEAFHQSYLFIAHDLAVVRHLSHRIVVLYKGRIVEEGPAAVVNERPLHPYTQLLMEAAPVADPVLQRQQREKRLAKARRAASFTTVVDGVGCAFAARCPFAVDVCRSTRPELEVTSIGSRVACHRWNDPLVNPLEATHAKATV